MLLSAMIWRYRHVPRVAMHHCLSESYLMKTLFFAAALLVPGLAYGQNPSADLSVQVVPPGRPSGIACAIGPNYTGTIPTDAQTAGFTTCALNSDFTTSQFATVSNWLGGTNCTFTGIGTPVWFNTDNGHGAAPCSDIRIITDGSNGTVADISYTQTDLSAGRLATQLSTVKQDSSQGHVFPSAVYFEWKGRVTSQSMASYNGSTNGSGGSGQFLLFGPFLYGDTAATTAGDHFCEQDFDEFYANPNAVAPGVINAFCSGSIGGPVPSAMQQCTTRCSNFDPTVMHVYGYLATTDGNQKLSVCTYVDGSKLGCSNMTRISPATTSFTTLQQMILELGPENTAPNSFHGPQDALVQYLRIFTCANWNQSGSTSNPIGNACSGPLVTN
jgi:hypothetical protein